MKIDRHFSEDIQTAIIIRGIKKINDLLEKFDRAGPVNSQRNFSSKNFSNDQNNSRSGSENYNQQQNITQNSQQQNQSRYKNNTNYNKNQNRYLGNNSNQGRYSNNDNKQENKNEYFQNKSDNNFDLHVNVSSHILSFVIF